MPPADGKHVTGLDEELYRKCSYNVGLYKNVVAKLDSGEIDRVDVEEYVSKKLRRWEEDFHVPYPLKYDRSWSELADEKSLPLMKQRLGQDVQPMLTPEEVEEQMEIATRCWKTLSKMQVHSVIHESSKDANALVMRANGKLQSKFHTMLLKWKDKISIDLSGAALPDP
ncbi:unnamed protein product [Symbiodinium sp. KB8]|nr:unnamed protein product [Symbiodinium sp. KB8]